MDFRTDEKLLSTLVLEMNNIGIDDFSNLVFGATQRERDREDQ